MQTSEILRVWFQTTEIKQVFQQRKSHKGMGFPAARIITMLQSYEVRKGIVSKQTMHI